MRLSAVLISSILDILAAEAALDPVAVRKALR